MSSNIRPLIGRLVRLTVTQEGVSLAAADSAGPAPTAAASGNGKGAAASGRAAEAGTRSEWQLLGAPWCGGPLLLSCVHHDME